MIFYRHTVRITLPPPNKAFHYDGLDLGISCTASDWQLSALAQVCSTSVPNPSTLEHLDIREDQSQPPHWPDNIEDIQWLELFHPFAAVKNLYLSKRLALHVAPALQELAGERVREVLPALQTIFIVESPLSKPVIAAFEPFITARRLSNHPVAIQVWGSWGYVWGAADD